MCWLKLRLRAESIPIAMGTPVQPVVFTRSSARHLPKASESQVSLASKRRGVVGCGQMCGGKCVGSGDCVGTSVGYDQLAVSLSGPHLLLVGPLESCA